MRKNLKIDDTLQMFVHLESIKTSHVENAKPE